MRFKLFLESKMTEKEALMVFGLPSSALGDKILIKKRFKELAKKYHPDKVKGTDEYMSKINLAYELLKKSKKIKDTNMKKGQRIDIKI